MKRILPTIILVIFAFITKAQSNISRFRVGVGPGITLPISRFSSEYSFGYGGDVQGEYQFSDKLSGVISTGYFRFVPKERTGGPTPEKFPKTDIISILTGLRFYPSTHFFIGARAGLGIRSTEGDGYGYFAYRPEIGYNSSHVQVSFNFNALTPDSRYDAHIGLAMIYVFGKK